MISNLQSCSFEIISIKWISETIMKQVQLSQLELLKIPFYRNRCV
jgi:hypothetical protein